MERSSKMAHATIDRISELPVDSRLHILSLSSTKAAVNTGVLSKRWARLWTSSPFLCFDSREFAAAGRPPSSFANFVDRVLALRRGSVSVARFEVRWYQGLDMPKLTTWLYYAMSHNLRELVLTIPTAPMLLPDSLFRSPSLEQCILKTADLIKTDFSKYAVLKLPSSMSLSKLTKLRLEKIVAPISFLGDLLTNSPVLEFLKIAIVGRGVVRASAPNLRRFTLRYDAINNNPRIQVFAPRLVEFAGYFPMIVPEINLRNIQSLAHAHICCFRNLYGNGANLYHILASIGNAEALVLVRDGIEIWMIQALYCSPSVWTRTGMTTMTRRSIVLSRHRTAPEHALCAVTVTPLVPTCAPMARERCVSSAELIG